jgi:hypothetical protein
MSRKLGEEGANHGGHGSRLCRQIESSASEEEKPHGHVQRHVGPVRHRREFWPDPRSQEPDQSHDFEISGSGHDDSEGENENAEGLFDGRLSGQFCHRSFRDCVQAERHLVQNLFKKKIKTVITPLYSQFLDFSGFNCMF